MNPSSADGLAACTSVQIRLHDDQTPACPDASKVGSVTIDTPLLSDPLDGRIYLATPHDNPFGTLLVDLHRGRGVRGDDQARRAESTRTRSRGQLTATFDDNPQTPFSNLHLEFDGGPRAPLVTPRAVRDVHDARRVRPAGTAEIVDLDSRVHDQRRRQRRRRARPAVRARLQRWDGEQPCGVGSSLFSSRFTRDDEDQELGGLTVDMPSGLTGRIANVDAVRRCAGESGDVPGQARRSAT